MRAFEARPPCHEGPSRGPPRDGDRIVQDTQGSDKGRVALVTGAARGIGLATTELLLQEGWKVALLDIEGGNLEATMGRLGAPEATLAIVADVSDPAQVKAAVQQVKERFGRLDALVNNAGIAIFKPLLETTFEEWSKVLAVNLSGPFLCTQAAAPLIEAGGGGAIVNITSISGLRASTLRVAYGTSKAGLAQLTKQQAIELAQYGIRVNAVAPGPVDTAMAKAVHSRRSAPPITTPCRSPATVWRASWRRPSCSCARPAPPTSPGRCWPWMAASRQPASACRPCAATTADPAQYKFAQFFTVTRAGQLYGKVLPLLRVTEATATARDAGVLPPGIPPRELYRHRPLRRRPPRPSPCLAARGAGSGDEPVRRGPVGGGDHRWRRALRDAGALYRTLFGPRPAPQPAAKAA